MAELKIVAMVSVIVGITVLVGSAQTTGGNVQPKAAEAPSRILPWEWWRDLTTVAVVPDDDETVMTSSFCPTGCEFDRHSEGDSRFLELRDDGEGVIFRAEGAGAVTRIWMVMGDGISGPLDPSIRLRVRIDGNRRPVVDLSLPELFGGMVAPFRPLLVVDRSVSGGGNVSYVPIPFRKGCEVSLFGAENSKIWFQVTARLVDDPAGVRAFTGNESLDGLRNLLQRAGADPWPGGVSSITSGIAVLGPGGSDTVSVFDGPDVVNGIIVRSPRDDWNRLGLRFTFDDREPLLIPLPDLFGITRVNQQVSRSLLVGGDGEDDLYCYFPMPFYESAKIELMRRPVEGPTRINVEYAVRRLGEPPPDGAGYFGVQIRDTKKSSSEGEIRILELDGRGSWVGLFASFGPGVENDWTFFEGDERVFVNGENTPSWHGTGVEDFFGGGFYFRGDAGGPEPFTQPLHGAPVVRFYHRPGPGMYRLMLGDAIVFRNGIHAELESGARGESSVRVRTVAYVYTARELTDNSVAPPEE